jgi:hypothetical protein
MNFHHLKPLGILPLAVLSFAPDPGQAASYGPRSLHREPSRDRPPARQTCIQRITYIEAVFAVGKHACPCGQTHMPYRIFSSPLARSAMTMPSAGKYTFSSLADERCPSMRKPSFNGRVSLVLAALSRFS